jgi:hypothetical protein
VRSVQCYELNMNGGKKEEQYDVMSFYKQLSLHNQYTQQMTGEKKYAYKLGIEGGEDNNDDG